MGTDISGFLKLLRVSRGYTQAALAEKLNISDKAVSRWEGGLGMPEISNLMMLAKIYGVLVDDILSCNEDILLPGAGKQPQPAELPLPVYANAQQVYVNAAPEKKREQPRENQTAERPSKQFQTVLFLAYAVFGMILFSLFNEQNYVLYIILAVFVSLLCATGILRKYFPSKAFTIIDISVYSAALIVLIVCMCLSVTIGGMYFSPLAYICLWILLLMQILYLIIDLQSNKIAKTALNYVTFGVAGSGLILSIVLVIIVGTSTSDGSAFFLSLDSYYSFWMIVSSMSLPIFGVMLCAACYSFYVCLGKVSVIFVPISFGIAFILPFIFGGPNMMPFNSVYMYSSGFFSVPTAYKLLALCPFAESFRTVFKSEKSKAVCGGIASVLYAGFAVVIAVFTIDTLIINIFYGFSIAGILASILIFSVLVALLVKSGFSIYKTITTLKRKEKNV